MNGSTNARKHLQIRYNQINIRKKRLYTFLLPLQRSAIITFYYCCYYYYYYCYNNSPTTTITFITAAIPITTIVISTLDT